MKYLKTDSFFIHFCFLILMTLLSSCANISQRPQELPMKSYVQQKQIIQAMNVWTVEGSVSVQSKTDVWQANLSWWQEHGRYQLLLSGPMGMGKTIVQGALPDDFEVTTSDGKRYQKDEARRLLEQQFGWTLPIQQMIYWVRGLTSLSSGPLTIEDAMGRLEQLKEREWTVDYIRYAPEQGVYLPSLLQISRPDFKLRMAIRTWKWS